MADNRNDHPEEEEGAHARMNNPRSSTSDTSQHGDEYMIDPDHLDFTQNNLLGSILLKLAHDTTQLAKACKLKEMETNIGDLCQDFKAALELEEGKIDAKAIQVTMRENERLLQRELDSHLLNQEIKPPEYFSPIPTLTNPHKMADCLKLFPSRSSKFSGSAKDNNMTIVEFLSLMKAAQNQCKLSEGEFRDMLLTSTTGRAHILLLEWIASGQSLNNIYHNLSLHFDKRLPAEEAKARLFSYKAPKNSNLAEVIAHIMELASRISSTLPDESSRKASYNHEVITALTQSLPSDSAKLVRSTYSTLSAKIGRALEASELTRALNVHRHSIDSDIKNHGAEANRGRTTKLGSQKINSKRNKMKNSNWQQFSSYNVQSTNKSIQQSQNLSQKVVKPYVNKSKQGSNQRSRSRSNYQDNSNSQNRQTFQNKQQRNPNKTRANNAITGCSLCGKNDHKASQICPNMRTDDGKIYKTLPVHMTCSLCPGNKKNTLNHPEMLCPYRKGGPFQKN